MTNSIKMTVNLDIENSQNYKRHSVRDRGVNPGDKFSKSKEGVTQGLLNDFNKVGIIIIVLCV